MAIPSSGQIKLDSNIRDEFDGSRPVSLSDYYRKGSNVPNTLDNANIPDVVGKGETAISFSHFRGSSSFERVCVQIDAYETVNFANYSGSWSDKTVKRETITSNYPSTTFDVPEFVVEIRGDEDEANNPYDDTDRAGVRNPGVQIYHKSTGTLVLSTRGVGSNDDDDGGYTPVSVPAKRESTTLTGDFDVYFIMGGYDGGAPQQRWDSPDFDLCYETTVDESITFSSGVTTVQAITSSGTISLDKTTGGAWVRFTAAGGAGGSAGVHRSNITNWSADGSKGGDGGEIYFRVDDVSQLNGTSVQFGNPGPGHGYAVTNDETRAGASAQSSTWTVGSGEIILSGGSAGGQGDTSGIASEPASAVDGSDGAVTTNTSGFNSNDSLSGMPQFYDENGSSASTLAWIQDETYGQGSTGNGSLLRKSGESSEPTFLFVGSATGGTGAILIVYDV